MKIISLNQGKHVLPEYPCIIIINGKHDGGVLPECTIYNLLGEKLWQTLTGNRYFGDYIWKYNVWVYIPATTKHTRVFNIK